MSEQASVYIVSGYTLLRKMFCSFFVGSGMAVLGETGDVEAAYQDIVRLRPQIVLLDIVLPGCSGLELTGRVLTALPKTRVIAVTAEPEEAWLLEFLSLGGMGYLRDCCAEADIVAAVQRVLAGNRHLEPAGMELLIGLACKEKAALAAETVGDDVPPQVLSDRERHVLHLYARGYSGVDIGSILFLSPSTVGTYIRRIREKLQIEKRADIVKYANRHNLYSDWR